MKIRAGGLRWIKIALITPIILFTLLFFAFAGGGQQYPNGVEAFLIGIAPPPGFYIKDYNYYYTATKLTNNNGNTVTLANSGQELDRVNVYAQVPRFIWITPLKILDGFYGIHLFVPVFYENISLDVLTPAGPTGLSEGRGAVGNLIFSPFIWSWHAKSGLLHMIAALDMFAPTGPYNPARILNIGFANFWTFEPVFAITGFLPSLPDLSGSIKLMYDFNTPNDDFIVGPATAAKIGSLLLTGLKTHLTPGQEFHFDYSIEYAITKNFRAGIAGYFYQQTTNDYTGFGTVQNDKGRVFAIGPGVWYTYKKWFAEAHVEFEMAAKNRPEGITSVLTITHAF